MSGGPYKKQDTWYTAEKCLQMGNYMFTIYDLFGDGLGKVVSNGVSFFDFTQVGEYEVNVDGLTTLSGGKNPFYTETGLIWNKCPASKAGKASSKGASKAGKASSEGGKIGGGSSIEGVQFDGLTISESFSM